jgi:hypothetical protein
MRATIGDRQVIGRPPEIELTACDSQPLRGTDQARTRVAGQTGESVLSKTSQPAIRQLRNEPNHVHGIEQARASLTATRPCRRSRQTSSGLRD